MAWANVPGVSPLNMGLAAVLPLAAAPTSPRLWPA
jgi:hypothetical protein